MNPQEKRAELDPASTSRSYAQMTPRWDKMQTLLGGTEAMRMAGKTYLPQHAGEKDPAYNERLHRTTLFNVTELTLDSWVGRPFSDPVRLNEDMPEEIRPMMDDVDLQGNDITVFCRSWFRDGLAKAFSHVLVDMPRVMDRPDGQPRTLEDDRKENLRPYWVHIPPENLIFAHYRLINGIETLTHARILEEDTVQVGFSEKMIRRIRVLEPGIVRVYEERHVQGKKKIEWIVTEEYATSINFVPIVTFYSHREGFMLGKSPLTDLADLNISHWQSSSDQTGVLTVARFPILALSGGVDDEKVLEVGPRKWLWTPDPNGKYYYVEHSGKAIEAGRQDLLDIEQRMAEYGAQFLKKRPGSPTATARALDSAESTSPLQDVTRRFIDSVDQALFYTAQWINLESGGSVEITTEFGPEEANASDLDALKSARVNRDISRETYVYELKRRGVLDEEYDSEEDSEKIERETLALAGATGLDMEDSKDDDTEDDTEGGDDQE